MIDHARIGSTFWNDSDDEQAKRITKASEDHDQLIEAIAAHDEEAAVAITVDHWQLSKDHIDIFIKPDPIMETMAIRIGPPRHVCFSGIYTPVITPFRDDFSIDENAYSEIIEKLIADGVHGIIIAGTTGEYYAQSMEERIHMLALGCEIINGRRPAIGGTGAIRTEDSIILAKAAKQAGVDAILIATPPYAQPTGRENALHALSVQRATGLPAMLYNYPGRMAAPMDESF